MMMNFWKPSKRKVNRRRPAIGKSETLEPRCMLDGASLLIVEDRVSARQNGPEIELDVLANDIFQPNYEGDQEITAKDHQSFRQQTLGIYQRQARSMTVDIETDCTYRHPEASAQGRWYGACEGGRATGHGYGVVRTDDGFDVEFLGDAVGGTANGAGAMIVHAPGILGASYYEGTFEGGLPHGTLRVEVAGRAPEVRRFEQGLDRGRGDAADVVRYPWR